MAGNAWLQVKLQPVRAAFAAGIFAVVMVAVAGMMWLAQPRARAGRDVAYELGAARVLIAAALVQAVLCALIAVCWVAARGAARKRLVQGGAGAAAVVLVVTSIAVFAIGMRGLAADAFAVTVGFLCAMGLVLSAFVTGLLALNAAALSERFRKD